LFADWTPGNLKPHTENVEVYSNCKEVELSLNGKSLGKKEINADASPRDWQVPFSSGTLKAVAWSGKLEITNVLRTAGKPVKIILATEHDDYLTNDWNDVAQVRAKVVDANGITVPRASDLIAFKITGSGVIAAVDNADNASTEPLQAASRHAFQGECVAFVKANTKSGRITLTATATGLKSSTMTLWASPGPAK
jgi:beta-galactosidase